MSSVPPPPPTVPPSPSPPTASLPWEDRGAMAAPEALLETVKALASNPRDAWARARESGGYGAPLLFAVIVSWVAVAVQSLWMGLFWRGAIPFLPHALAGRFPGVLGLGRAFIAIRLILAPIGVVVGLFVAAAILHVCYLLVGALRASVSGFEGTLRVVAYSSVASLGQIIPLVGGLLAIVAWIILATFGGARMHRTTTGKALAAILIPIALLCVGLAVAMIVVFAVIAGRGGLR